MWQWWKCWRKVHRQIIMDKDFSDVAFIAETQTPIYCTFEEQNLVKDQKVPLSFGYSPCLQSFDCHSQSGRGLGSNQSAWLGVSGSSCYKQPEVVSVANTTLTDRASLASMIIRAESLLISPLHFHIQCNSNCEVLRRGCNYQGLKLQH